MTPRPGPVRRSVRVGWAAGPPLALALVGAFHPDHLTMSTAARWRDLHLVLLPLFPLLAVGPWLLARQQGRTIGRVVGALGYTYACCYTALDVLAGIAAGALRLRDLPSGVEIAFSWADAVARWGVVAYLVASALAAAAVARSAGRRALPGCVLVTAAACSFLTSHVFWPRGVLTMLAAAVGWTALAVVAGDPTEETGQRPVPP
jgi:hypothetical protein